MGSREVVRLCIEQPLTRAFRLRTIVGSALGAPPVRGKGIAPTHSDFPYWSDLLFCLLQRTSGV